MKPNTTRAQRSSTRNLRHDTGVDRPVPLANTAAEQAKALGTGAGAGQEREQEKDHDERGHELLRPSWHDMPLWRRMMVK